MAKQNIINNPEIPPIYDDYKSYVFELIKNNHPFFDTYRDAHKDYSKVYKNPDGTISTTLSAYMTFDDGRAAVYPNIYVDDKGNYQAFLDTDEGQQQAYDYARKKGLAIDFMNKEDADDFSRQYKNYYGTINSFIGENKLDVEIEDNQSLEDEVEQDEETNLPPNPKIPFKNRINLDIPEVGKDEKTQDIINLDLESIFNKNKNDEGPGDDEYTKSLKDLLRHVGGKTSENLDSYRKHLYGKSILDTLMNMYDYKTALRDTYTPINTSLAVSPQMPSTRLQDEQQAEKTMYSLFAASQKQAQREGKTDLIHGIMANTMEGLGKYREELARKELERQNMQSRQDAQVSAQNAQMENQTAMFNKQMGEQDKDRKRKALSNFLSNISTTLKDHIEGKFDVENQKLLSDIYYKLSDAALTKEQSERILMMLMAYLDKVAGNASVTSLFTTSKREGIGIGKK